MKFSYNQKIKKLKLDRNSENEIIIDTIYRFRKDFVIYIR